MPATHEWVSTLDGSTNVEVKARIDGYLQSKLYRDGAVVHAGDPLFVIDPRPLQAQLAQAKANLASQQAKQVQTDLTEKRTLALFASKTVSTEERDQALSDNAAAKAGVMSGQAAVTQAQLNLEYTTITAPIDGIAGVAVPAIGDLVGPSMGALASLSTVDPIKAVVQISEAEYLASALAKNSQHTSAPQAIDAELYLVLADGSIHPHQGRFNAIDRQFDVRTGTIRVEALFPNPGNILRPGFFARTRLVVKSKKPSLIIPQRAVTDLQGVHLVAVVGPDNKVAVHRVKMGRREGSRWIVEEGLKPGEMIVVEGVQKARDGVIVNPQPFVPHAPSDRPSQHDQPTTSTDETTTQAR